MFKKIFLISAFTVALLGATENALLKMIPENSEVVVSANLTTLFNLPELRKGMAENKLLAQWQEDNNYRLEDMEAAVFFFRPEPAPGIYAALLSFRRTPPLEKLTSIPESKCTKSTIGKYQVYLLHPPNSPTPLAVGLLNPKTVLVAPRTDFIRAAELTASGARGFVFPKKLSGILRVFYRPIKAAEFKSVTGALRLTGAKNSDLQLAIDLTMNSAEAAAQLAQQLPIYLMLGCGMGFADNPALGAKLSQAFKVERKENSPEIRISALFPEKLLRAVGKHAEMQAKKQRELKNMPARPEQKPVGVAAPAAK